MIQTYYFPDVTLLITHYNRSHSLENSLTTFQRLNCRFGDIVVSDDGSKEPHRVHLTQLQQTFGFQLITTPTNKGLGNNINKGQDAVKTPYTLYVQEDFEPTVEFPDRLIESLKIIKERPDFDVIRFYAYVRYPYLKPYNDGFSEMVIPPWATRYTKIYAYSDHPHLRHSSFFEKFGRYVEGLRPDKTEYWMCISFIQKKGQGLFYENFKQLFHQKNSQEEPSTYSMKQWSKSKNSVLVFFRHIYRQVKYNYDIYFR
ncbi:glycosyltransferase [Spirosoma sp. HMF3257]|uniref:Glycosyl transferase family 2 n=1 Tax=Spirosoma telluris TaxID=2183553 RepID=A0A327NJ83_9BACT|nr:glycosyltransferase [Spirosoma telluris]RAI74066.1 glycosyl transferase family 2 [Spirosoma telluris]